MVDYRTIKCLPFGGNSPNLPLATLCEVAAQQKDAWMARLDYAVVRSGDLERRPAAMARPLNNSVRAPAANAGSISGASVNELRLKSTLTNSVLESEKTTFAVADCAPAKIGRPAASYAPCELTIANCEPSFCVAAGGNFQMGYSYGDTLAISKLSSTGGTPRNTGPVK